jgi:D-alanine-D-alanine ligase
MKITVIYGGKSGEHEVSLVSATSVVKNIDLTKHSVNLIGITKEGKWFYQEESELNRIKEDEKATLQIKEKYPVVIVPAGSKQNAIQVETNGKYTNLYTDIVFPVLHGTFGEDGTIQGLFEMAELPYVGCATMASSLTMDKEKTKQIWESANLPVVPYICARKFEAETEQDLSTLEEKSKNQFGYPVFIKPCCAGSSVGASKAANKEEFEKSVKEAFSWDDKILIEPFVKAREIECSVIGNEKQTSFVPCEILPTHEFYDYEAKYKDPDGALFSIPANLSEEQIVQVKTLAEKAYKVLDASGLSRVDFFIDKENGNLMLNEINTMPGFTSISMFPQMCNAGGLKYADLIEELINLGINRFEKKRELLTSR